MNREQRQILHKWFSTSRYVYNKTLEQTKRQKINFQSLRNQLVTKTYKIRYCPRCFERTETLKCCGIHTIERKLNNFRIKEWQTDTPKEIRAHSVKDVVKAYKTCFSQNHIFHIKFKSKKCKTGSLGIAKQSVSLKNGALCIYPTFLTPIPLGKRTLKQIKNIHYDCRLSFDGRYFYLLIPYKKETRKTTNTKTIALDPGVRTFQTGYSEDTIIQIDRTELLKKLKKKLDFLSSQRKYKYKRMKTQHRIRHVVDDLHWKTITFLTKHYQHILLPHFDSQGMMGKNRKVNRDLNLLKHYLFQCRLKEKVNEIHGLHVYLVNESFTSKTCSLCGTINPFLGSDKIFTCVSGDCKMVMDRDINASRNIFIKHCS